MVNSKTKRRAGLIALALMLSLLANLGLSTLTEKMGLVVPVDIDGSRRVSAYLKLSYSHKQKTLFISYKPNPDDMEQFRRDAVVMIKRFVPEARNRGCGALIVATNVGFTMNQTQVVIRDTDPQWAEVLAHTKDLRVGH